MQEIVMIDGLYKLPELILNSPNEKRFDYIYNSGAWAKSTNGESVSGSGSTIAYTELYRDQLKQFFGMQSDTLRSVKIHFSPTVNDVSNEPLYWRRYFG